MSYWTSIMAVIEIDLMDLFLPKIWADEEKAMVTQEEIDSKAQEIFDNMPRITGSEVDADTFLNHGSWEGMSVPKDCRAENVEYVDYRFKYFITIWGALRDRFKADTEKEFKALMAYLREKVDATHQPGDESSVGSIQSIIGD